MQSSTQNRNGYISLELDSKSPASFGPSETQERKYSFQDASNGLRVKILAAWKQAVHICHHLSPELVAIAIVYLVQGLTELADLANEYLMKDSLDASPAEVAGYQSASNIPWMLKPLIGFITDSIPLFGYKRRSYLLIASITGAATWIATSIWVNSKGSFLAMMLINSTAGAFSDVVADTIVVDMARGETQATSGSLQSLCWSAYAVGEIATAYFSGSLVEGHGPRFVIGLTAIFPMLVAVAACRVTDAAVHTKRAEHNVEPLAPSMQSVESEEDLNQEATQKEDSDRQISGTAHTTSAQHPRQSTSHHVSTAIHTPIRAPHIPASHDADTHTSNTSHLQIPVPLSPQDSTTQPKPNIIAALQNSFHLLRQAMFRPTVLWPTAYIFFLSATPGASSAMFYFQTVELGFTPKFLGEIQLVAAISSLVGVILYERCFKQVPLRRMMFWGTLLLLILEANQLILVMRWNVKLGLSDELFTLGGSVMTDVVLSVLGMPVLVLAARLCPVGIEGTMFATLMSITNFASGVSGATGAALMELMGITADNFDHLPLLLVICNLTTLLPLPLLLLIPNEYNSDPDEASTHRSDTLTLHDSIPSESRSGEPAPAQIAEDEKDEGDDLRPLLQRRAGRKSEDSARSSGSPSKQNIILPVFVIEDE